MNSPKGWPFATVIAWLRAWVRREHPAQAQGGKAAGLAATVDICEPLGKSINS
jgi:hypothetical protein